MPARYSDKQEPNFVPQDFSWAQDTHQHGCGCTSDNHCNRSPCAHHSGTRANDHGCTHDHPGSTNHGDASNHGSAQDHIISDNYGDVHNCSTHHDKYRDGGALRNAYRGCRTHAVVAGFATASNTRHGGMPDRTASV